MNNNSVLQFYKHHRSKKSISKFCCGEGPHKISISSLEKKDTKKIVGFFH